MVCTGWRLRGARRAARAGRSIYYYEMPTRADMSARELQLKALHADISKGVTTAKKLPEFRSQVTELEGRLDNLKSVLPEEKDAADLLRRMQTVATQSSLTIKSFKPALVVTKQLHAEWPINLELAGHLSQPRDLLRPRRPLHAHREHQRPRREGRGQARSEQHDHRDLRRDDLRAARQAGRAAGGAKGRAAAAEGLVTVRVTTSLIGAALLGVMAHAQAPPHAAGGDAAAGRRGTGARSGPGPGRGDAAERRDLHVYAGRPPRSVSQPARLGQRLAHRRRSASMVRRPSVPARFRCAASCRVAARWSR